MPLAETISADPRFTSALQELKLEAAGAPGASGRVRKSAPRNLTLVLVALELTVMSESVPLYMRLWCWWRRVKSAATLRHDDHRGWDPTRTVLTGRGLSTILGRTRTSGAGKKRESLPLYVSAQAYFADTRWLETGWQLWADAAPFERDYFLAMPARNLEGVVRHEVRYADALLLSRSLGVQLARPVWDSELGGWALSDEPLFFVEGVVDYWSEHSERSDAPSAAPLLGYPQEWVDSLGNWGGDGSEVYCRTRRARAERIQAHIAAEVRAHRAGRDVFDEEESLATLRQWMLERGVDDAEARAQCDLLMYFGREGPAAKVSRTETVESVEFVVPRDSTTPLLDPEEDPITVDASTDTIKVQRPSLTRADVSDHTFSDPVPEGYCGYVISFRRNSARLHRRGDGGCWRVPGVHYHHYMICGGKLPPAETYNDFCHTCWPGETEPASGQSSSCAGSGSSSSSSSSS